MLSKELEQTLNDAFRDARERRHEFMTVEHLLFALLANPTAVQLLTACGCLLYTSPSPRDGLLSRMPSSA